MKFRTQRDVLLRPLRMLAGVVERRQTLPVLSNLLIEVSDSGVMLRGTDLQLEVVVRASEGIEVAQGGAATVPAHKMAEIWQSLPEGAQVQIALESERVVIRSGRSRFALATIPVADFPSSQGDGQDEEGPSQKVALQQADMRRLIERTKCAMAIQDVRYFLNGMLFELDGNALRAAASDGHRMALCTVDGGADVADRLRLIVPRKSVLEMERLIAESDEQVQLVLGRNYIRLTQGGYTLTSKLIDGQFPEVDRIIPKDANKTILGDRETLRSALHRAAILSSEKSSEVRFHISADQLMLRASNPAEDEAEEAVAIEYAGEAIEVGFNVRYIQDVLNALDTESVKFSLPENNGIAVIEGPGAEEALYLVMPLRM